MRFSYLVKEYKKKGWVGTLFVTRPQRGRFYVAQEALGENSTNTIGDYVCRI